MKNLKLYIVLAVGLLATIAVQAQDNRLKLNVNYNVGIPSGSFQDYVGNTSYRGWTGNVTYDLNNHIAIGLGAGYQDFYEKHPRTMYKLSDGGDISAVVSYSIQTIPALAMVRYNITPGSSVQPYIGVGAGGNFVMFNQYLGEFNNSQSKVKFAARPEAGVFIPFRKAGQTGVNINGVYNYMPFNEYGIDNLSNWGVGVGLSFPLK